VAAAVGRRRSDRPVTAPRGAPGALSCREFVRTAAGTLAVRGPLVPKFGLPFEIDVAAKPAFAVDADGFADTGYPCTVDPADARAHHHRRPPASSASRLPFAELPLWGSRRSPMGWVGHRLSGTATDAERMREELASAAPTRSSSRLFGPDRAA